MIMEIRKNLASGAAAVVSEGELAEINRCPAPVRQRGGSGF